MGMAAACGYDVNEEWIKAVVQRRKALARNSADWTSSTKVFDKFTTLAYVMQATEPDLSCRQVRKMMRDSEEKLL